MSVRRFRRFGWLPGLLIPAGACVAGVVAWVTSLPETASMVLVQLGSIIGLVIAIAVSYAWEPWA